jgi:hypothetical protein
MRGEHIRLIAIQTVRQLFRNGTGIAFAFLLLTSGLVTAAVFVTPIEFFLKGTRGGVGSARARNELGAFLGRSEVSGKARTWLGIDEEQSRFWIDDMPALVSGFLLVTLMGVPSLVAVGAYNQTGAEIQSKGLRYLLLRTERANIYLGRLAGVLLMTAGLTGAMFAVVTLYLVVKVPIYGPGETILWMAWGWAAVMLLALPYAAMAAAVSAAVATPRGSLFACLGYAKGLPLLATWFAAYDPRYEFLYYLTPWPLRYELLSPGARFPAAAVLMLLYTAFFLTLGLRNFLRRDL